MAMSDELGKLADLHQRGVLTDAEFATAKARVFADAAGARPQSPAVGTINAFRRSLGNRWLGGVCGGIEGITGVDAWVWRLSFTLLVLCAGTGVMLYLLMWLFVPEESGPLPQRPADLRSI